MAAVAKAGLSPETVLLAIEELVQEKNRVWRGTVAKHLSNGTDVTEETVKPFIVQLIEAGYVEKDRVEPKGRKWKGNTKWIPPLILTKEGKKEIERLKAEKLKAVQN